MSPFTIIRRAAAIAVTSGLGLALVAPAQAAPIDGGFYSGSVSFVACGRYDEVLAFSGLFMIKDSTPAADGQFFSFQDNAEYRAVITNPSNGKWMVARGNFVVKELRARQLDGDVFSYEWRQSGMPYVLEDSAGRVVLRDSGIIVVSYVFDTLGDGGPGGEVLEDPELVRVSGPHPGYLGTVDFCELADELIG